MRHPFDLARFDPHPAFHLYRGFRRKRGRLRLAFPTPSDREPRGSSAADGSDAPNNLEPR